MRPKMEFMLTEIKDVSKRDVIAASISGLLVGSTITHGEMISAMQSIITKAVEIETGLWQNNLNIDPSAGEFIAPAPALALS